MRSDSGWPKIVGVLMIPVFGVALIGGIRFAWVSSRVYTVDILGRLAVETNWIQFILTSLGVVLFVAFGLALTSMLLTMASNIEETLETDYEILNLLRKNSVSSNESAAPLLSTTVKSTPTVGGIWICSHCGDKSPAGTRNCTSCGKDR
jgi:hypothetical protein